MTKIQLDDILAKNGHFKHHESKQTYVGQTNHVCCFKIFRYKTTFCKEFVFIGSKDFNVYHT